MGNKIGNMILSGVCGAWAGFSSYLALDCILKYVSIKSAVFQAELAKAPELTERVYDLAWKAAERASSGDFYSGLALAIEAGAGAGYAVYFACRKD